MQYVFYSENAMNDKNNSFQFDPFFPFLSLCFLPMIEPGLFTPGFTDSSFTGFEIVSFASLGCLLLFFIF